MTTSYANTGGTGSRTGIITASTTASLGGSSGPVARLVDGNKATGSGNAIWVAPGQLVTMSFTFDFGSGASKVIDEAKWYQDISAAQNGVWKWQGSNDNSSYTDLSATFVLNGVSTGSVIGNLSGNTTGWRYYRLLQTTLQSGNDSAWLEEIEFKIDDAASEADITAAATLGITQAVTLGVEKDVPSTNHTLGVAMAVTMTNTVVAHAQPVVVSMS